MSQRVTKECHAAQNDIRAHHRADDADQDRGHHAALHEFVLEGSKEERHSIYDFGFTIVDYDLRLRRVLMEAIVIERISSVSL